MDVNNDFDLVEYIRSFFKKKRLIKVGDIGIYKDVLTINTLNKSTHDLFYDYYAKVKVVAVYNNMVETERLDLTILNANNQEINSLIEAQIPKYLHPNYIQWEER